MTRKLHLAAFQTDFAHNLGSMIRLCACFGVTLDIIEPCGFPLSQKSLKEAALDYSDQCEICLLYTSPSPRDQRGSRMPSSA